MVVVVVVVVVVPSGFVLVTVTVLVLRAGIVEVGGVDAVGGEAARAGLSYGKVYRFRKSGKRKVGVFFCSQIIF